MAAVALLLTACAGPSAVQPAPPVAAQLPVARTPTSRPAAPPSPLSRTDDIPAGVDAGYDRALPLLMSVRSGCYHTVWTCDRRSCTRPRTLKVLGTRSSLPRSPVTVCAEGFALGSTLEITSPSGATLTYRPGADEDHVAWDTRLPPGPAGTYVITASTSAQFSLREELEVVAAPRPTLQHDSSLSHPGDVFSIYLIGFPPDQRLPLHLYREPVAAADEDTADAADEVLPVATYVTSFVVDTDADGLGELHIPSAPGDPITTYILVEPGTGAATTFSLDAEEADDPDEP